MPAGLAMLDLSRGRDQIESSPSGPPVQGLSRGLTTKSHKTVLLTERATKFSTFMEEESEIHQTLDPHEDVGGLHQERVSNPPSFLCTLHMQHLHVAHTPGVLNQ